MGGMAAPPIAIMSRDPLADSITRVASPQYPDTTRDQSRRLQDSTNDSVPEISAESLEWDEEEESTHVFKSSHPPPPMRSGAANPYGSTLQSSNGSLDPRVPTARGLAPEASGVGARNDRGFLGAPPTTDTLRLDAFEQQQGHAQARAGGGPMFPPPPPIPSITQARPMGEQSVPGITNPVQAQEIVRDQPFVRLPTGNPHTATELAIKKPTLPGNYIPPATLGPSQLPSFNYVPTSIERRDSKRWILGAAAAAALLSIAALVGFLFTRRPGGVQVEVKDASGASVPKAEVYVDGRKVCEATPCVVRDLDVGRHLVRVMTPTETGLEPLSVEIEAGSITPIAVTLKPQLGTFAAGAAQAGVRLVFDGVDKGELPVKITDLAPGKHEVRLTSDRHKTFEKTVEIKVGETLQLDLPKLTVTRGRVTVNVKTEGVSIVIIPNADPTRPKALDGPFPRAIEVDTSSGTYKLVAKKKGLPDFAQELDFSDGVAEKTIDVVLTEESKTEPATPEPIAVASLPSPVTTNPTGTRPPTNSAPLRPTAADVPDPPPAAQGGMGTLNINSLPASRVLLDGSPLGETPRMGISVTAGTHTVTFIHPELGKKSMSIKVGAGETKTASARLRKD